MESSEAACRMGWLGDRVSYMMRGKAKGSVVGFLRGVWVLEARVVVTCFTTLVIYSVLGGGNACLGDFFGFLNRQVGMSRALF